MRTGQCYISSSLGLGRAEVGVLVRTVVYYVACNLPEEKSVYHVEDVDGAADGEEEGDEREAAEDVDSAWRDAADAAEELGMIVAQRLAFPVACVRACMCVWCKGSRLPLRSWKKLDSIVGVSVANLADAEEGITCSDGSLCQHAPINRQNNMCV
eukprot:5624207-Amphidinium_carterae.1